MNKAIPLIAAGGAALVFLSKKKKKKSFKGDNGNGNGDGNGNGNGGVDGLDIHSSGKSQGWDWRVVKVISEPGFAGGYIGEKKAPEAQGWSLCHDNPRANPDECRLLCLESIALAQQ